MAEENTQNEVIDLDFDVNEADVARPVLKDGTYDMTIAYTRQETSKNGHPMILVGYRLAQDAEDTQGRKVNPGFTLNQRYLTQPTGKMTKEQVQDRFKRIHFAAAGEGKVNTGAWIGKTVRARVKIREAQGEFGESNDISTVYPKK